MAEPDGVPQEAWIHLGAVQELVRTPDLSKETENVPLKDDIEDYLDREVRPYAPGAWVDPVKDRRTKKRVAGIVGYEIPFTRYFFEYKPLRSRTDILKDLAEIEASIAKKSKLMRIY